MIFWQLPKGDCFFYGLKRGINMADTNKNINENYIEEIKKAVKEIKYGSLTLIIQDGKVIQIDKTEKVRL